MSNPKKGGRKKRKYYSVICVTTEEYPLLCAVDEKDAIENIKRCGIPLKSKSEFIAKKINEEVV